MEAKVTTNFVATKYASYEQITTFAQTLKDP